MCRHLIILGLLAAASVPSVSASPIQFVFTGTNAVGYNSSGPSTPAPFQLTLTYDPANALPDSSLPNSSVTLNVAGSTVYSLVPSQPIYINPGPVPYIDYPPPVPLTTGASIDLGPSGNASFLSLNLTSNVAFGGQWDTFPSLLPSLASGFNQGSFDLFLAGNQGSQVHYTGTIDSVTVVPEPPFATLFCMIGGGLALRRLRR